MKIPKMLAEYLESTDQFIAEMTDSELLKEAEWVLYMYQSGEFDDTPQNAKKLKSFINRFSKKH